MRFCIYSLVIASPFKAIRRSFLSLACLIFIVADLPAQDWKTQAVHILPERYGIADIHAVDENVVWAIANETSSNIPPILHEIKVIKSLDGGNTWEIHEVENNLGRYAYDIHAFDASRAFITTNDEGNGQGKGLLLTTDGGETWLVNHEADEGGLWVHFFNAEEGIILNRHRMARTLDGGNSWNKSQNSLDQLFKNDERIESKAGTNGFQVMGDHLWFGTSKGRVFRSADKGHSWDAHYTGLGDNSNIKAIAFYDTLTGIALKTSSFIEMFSGTGDGGVTWEPIPTPSTPPYSIDNIQFIPGTNGKLLGTSSDYRCAVLSEDFARSWHLTYGNGPFGCIEFLNENTGWISSNHLGQSNGEAIFKWNFKEGPNTWEPAAVGLLQPSYGIYAISIVDEDVAWAVAWDQSVTSDIPVDHMIKILLTTDGGQTWRVRDVKEAPGRISYDIIAFDEHVAFLTTQDKDNGQGRGLFRTENGGISWQEVYRGHAGGVWVRFFNKFDGVIINGRSVATTNDGGFSWTPIDQSGAPKFKDDEYIAIRSGSNSLQQIDDYLWFGTTRGRVMRSRDKGNSWEAFTTSFGSEGLINSLSFADTLNGVALDLITGNLSKTSDGGETWSDVSLDRDLSLNNITFVPETNGLLMGTSYNYRLCAFSPDFGETWVTTKGNAPFSPITFRGFRTGMVGAEWVITHREPAIFKWNKDSTVPIDDIIKQVEGIRVLPNPATDFIVVECEEGINKPFALYSSSGQLIKSGILDSPSNQIFINNLQEGIYFLKVRLGNSTLTRKVIKI